MCVMIVRDLVVLILDVDVVLIQGDFVVGSLKYSGKGQPLKSFISSTAKTNMVQKPTQKANNI